MTRLPVISGEECINALQRLGYVITRTRGSHVRLTCPNRKPVTVPLHYELDRTTLKSILRTIEVSTEEFVSLLT